MTALPPLTPSELSDLKAKAKAATPGPWVAEGAAVGNSDARPVKAKGAFDWIGAFWLQTSNCPNWRNDQAHIAAANPETILRLIDMVERREALALAAREVVEDVLLAGSIDSRFSLSNVPPSSTTAKLIRLRETLAATEPK